MAGQVAIDSIDTVTKIGKSVVEGIYCLLKSPQAVAQVVLTAVDIVEARAKSRKAVLQDTKVLVKVSEALIEAIWNAVNMI